MSWLSLICGFGFILTMVYLHEIGLDWVGLILAVLVGIVYLFIYTENKIKK